MSIQIMRDKQTEKTVVISGSSAVVLNAIDLEDPERVIRGDIEFVVQITDYNSGEAHIDLTTADDIDLSVNAISEYVSRQVLQNDTLVMVVPQSVTAGKKFIGLVQRAVAADLTVTSHAQSIQMRNMGR